MGDQYKWGVVLIACMAIFIIVLDSSAMNVAISTLVVELNTTLSIIQSIYCVILTFVKAVVNQCRLFFTGI